MTANYRRITVANNVLVTIKTIFHHIQHGYHDYLEKIQNKEELRRLGTMGMEAKRKVPNNLKY